MIAVTFALPSESSAFVSLLKDRRREDFTRFGMIGDKQVAVVHTGVGAQKCGERLNHFFRKHKPRMIIASGFCGGTTDEVLPGDLIIASNGSDPELARRASELLRGAVIGKIFSAGSVIDPAADRYAIAREHGAIAIDMETETTARFCIDIAVPMLALRVISDSAAAPFPAPPEILFDVEKQRTRFTRLITHVVRDPATVARLANFSRQITMAKNKLADALQLLLREF
jgi:Purine-nucleoside phosphorylase